MADSQREERRTNEWKDTRPTKIEVIKKFTYP